MSGKVSRRLFAATSLFGPPASASRAVRGASERTARANVALQLRLDAATKQSEVQAAAAESNGDESSVARWSGVFTKGLPHDQNGEVIPSAYQSLLSALATGNPADFERVSRGSGRRLVSPQAAYAFQLEGCDSHVLAAPAPPSFSSPEAASEMRELYWQALCRDIPFAAFSEASLIRLASADLAADPRGIFRGTSPGSQAGPYLSQFLVKPIPFNSTMVEQRYRMPRAGLDYVTSYSEWLQLQNGVPPWRERTWDESPRYIRSGRDLAEWVHHDFLYQAFLNAAVIIMDLRPENVLSDRRHLLNPSNPYRYSNVQDGFVTFGPAEVVDWLARVTTAALKAAWFQKWLVHRRLRPEEFGGRIHHTRTRRVAYPIPDSLLACAAVDGVFAQTGTYLLPQVYAEGCPLHPAYPSGHATVAGACSVVLKALFDESALVPDCVHPTPDGLSLEPCPSSFAPTIGAEVDKLAFNIAMGRNWAGIHYRSDALGGIRLGEEVGLAVLRDLVRCCTEEFEPLTLTRYDGTSVQIARA